MTAKSLRRNGCAGAAASLALAVTLLVFTGSSSAAAQEEPTNTAPPSISGSERQGETLHASRGEWSNGSDDSSDYSYQWQRCKPDGSDCADIAGATDNDYRLSSGDVGRRIRVLVTARNSDGRSSAASAPTGVIAAAGSVPTNSSPPTISGTPQDNQTLTASSGSWGGSDPKTYTYTWQRCDQNGNNCSGIATGQSYKLTSHEVGHRLLVVVTATNSAGSASAESAATAVIAAAGSAPKNTSAPTISGTPQQGQTLTGQRGSWDNQPTTFVDAWLRCDQIGGSCSIITGAAGTKYTLISSDVGKTIRFRVTATNAAGSTTALSLPTAVVQKASAPAPAPPPRPSGCPPRPSVRQVANIATIAPPARLLIDTLRSQPRVVTRRTFTLVVRFHVSSTCGGPVQGALVYATATPYNQFAIPTETVTDPGGWATLVFRRLRGFPVSRHQQLIAMFVRARKPGENLLGGISTRRLVSIRVNLRG